MNQKYICLHFRNTSENVFFLLMDPENHFKNLQGFEKQTSQSGSKAIFSLSIGLEES